MSYVLRPHVRSAGPAPSRRNRIASGPRGSASREVLAPSNTATPGAPSPSRPSLRSIVRDEDRQTLVGAVLRVLAPLDGSSCLAARSRSFGPRRSPWTPTLRGLVPCRSRSWSAPPELSLPGEPYPLSRVVSSLRVRSPTAAGAEPAGSSRPLSPDRASSSPHAPTRRWTRDYMSCDGGSLRSLVRSPRHTEVCRTYRPHPTDTGLAGKRPARPLRSFAPPGSPFSDDPTPGQAEIVRRCSPGVLAPPELTPPRFGVRSLAATHAGGVSPIHVRLRAPSRRGCIPRPGLRRLSSRAQDPSTRGVYRTPRITVRRRPSS